MERSRIWMVVALGAIVLAAVFAFGRSQRAPRSANHAPTATQAPPPPPREPMPIARPAAASIDLGVMSDRPEKELAAVAKLDAALALLGEKHCGSACEAVRAFAKGEGHVALEVRDAPGWRMPRPDDLARAASLLTEAERAKFAKSPRVITVNATGPALPDELPLRAAFAIAAAIAEKLGAAGQAFVYDPALDRVEKPAQLLAHAVTEPLGAPTFRRDRIDFQYQPRDESTLRALTTGMSRYGAPDLEIANGPKALLTRLVDALAAIAAKVADGAKESPIAIGLRDLDRVRAAQLAPAAADAADAGDAGDEAEETLAIDLLAVHPENGDPSAFMARVVPPEGATVAGYEAMVDSLFGPSDEGMETPSPEEFRATRERTQAALANVLARFKQSRQSRKPASDAGDASVELYVQLPFVPAGSEAGAGSADTSAFEWMWIEVTSFDDTTVTGTLVDDPEEVPSLGRGDSVTRKREEISDYLLKLPGGATESGSIGD